MTMDQVSMYYQVVAKDLLRTQLTEMTTFRIAYHAEGKEYSKIVRDYERKLKRD